ncbi:hypothetical protein B0H66DRAFT_129525 [Apodospora peruviana]|uniref:Glycoside hydrolase subgroup catalytic core n=1 Tax=Apodospora peruviana TaxID=516989 RepID=A0AAE0IHZ7_9PEZI|nr:hypothetical protein B0H66DRAFT_129525 [Apodospora peruviana]
MDQQQMSWRASPVAAMMTAFFMIIMMTVIPGTNGQDQQTGNHPDWPRWCGKVYEAGYPAFDPGGQTVPPTPIGGAAPLLDVQFKPRYSLYLDSETQGEFVVNAPLSQFHGSPWKKTGNGTRSDWLIFSIHMTETDDVLVANKVVVNTTGNVFAFDLSRLRRPADLKPIKVVLYAAPEGGDPTWTATSEILYLPEKKNKTGSVTRLDNLRGGMWFRNTASDQKFAPLLPYGFYSSYDGFLGNNRTAEIEHYADLGLNTITPLTIYRDSTPAFDYMDRIDLKFMYNLREGYKNLTYVREQVLAARDADAIYAYWSADEPDGWQDPFSIPRAAYDLIRQLDPYHPVAVVLNCQNYYFQEYTDGAADIIMEDVYPIGINSTFSKWGTACNATLGDCGCDNCDGNMQDVPERLDTLARYEDWLGLWPKTKVHNPQSFHGQDYWFRDPSPFEEYVMCLLAFNHGAKGIISWVYPTSELLGQAHGALARVVTRSPVVDFIVGTQDDSISGPYRTTPDAAGDVVDVAYWVDGGRRQMLVSVVNGGYADIEQIVNVAVPNAIVVSSVAWMSGNASWKLEGERLSAARLPALSTTLVILDLKTV